MLDLLNQSLSLVLSNSITRFVLAILAGILLALSLPGYGIGFLAWFALIPLFLLIKSSNNPLGSLIDSIFFFFSFYCASFLWLLTLHPLTWQGLSNQESIVVSLAAWLTPCVTHTILMSIFALILKLFFMFRAEERTCELKIIDILFLAFLWSVLQYKVFQNLGPDIRGFFVPLNMLAYSQAQALEFIQIADHIGAIGIEFIIVFINLFCSNFFNVHKINQDEKVYTNNLNIHKQNFGLEKSSDYLTTGIILTALLVANLFYGYNKINHYDKLRNKSKLNTIAILQADYNAKSTRQDVGFDKLIEMQFRLSQSLSKRVDFLFWSEGAIPSTTIDKEDIAIKLKDLTHNFSFGTFKAIDGKIYNAIENYSFRDELAKVHSIKASLDLNGNELTNLETISKANTFSKSSSYEKNILVAFGEYTPFYKQLPNSIKILASHSIGSGFSASQEIKNIETFYGNFAPSICFEILFPEHVRSFINKETKFLVNINDLSWFKNPIKIFSFELSFIKGFIQRMMLAAAQFRAIENNRDLILVSNSGISTVIRANGKTGKQSSSNKIEIIEDKVLGLEAISVYTKFGW